jgi:energy-coupling factor transporter ATP-binding protein EcfA2
MTTTSSQAAITATGLRRSYGDKLVLDGIDLGLPAGTILALLDPNGAGKTTTVQILSTLISADATHGLHLALLSAPPPRPVLPSSPWSCCEACAPAPSPMGDGHWARVGDAHPR